MKALLLILTLSLGACSSINSTFIKNTPKGEKVFAGTKNNMNWIADKEKKLEKHPYTTMGIVDFIPSAVFDLLLLPYTLYDYYSGGSKDKKD